MVCRAVRWEADKPVRVHWRKSYNLSRAAFACPMDDETSWHRSGSLKSMGGNLYCTSSARDARGEAREDATTMLEMAFFRNLGCFIASSPFHAFMPCHMPPSTNQKTTPGRSMLAIQGDESGVVGVVASGRLHWLDAPRKTRLSFSCLRRHVHIITSSLSDRCREYTKRSSLHKFITNACFGTCKDCWKLCVQ